MHYAYDPKKNKLEKIGKYPWNSFFKGKIVCWIDWQNDIFENNKIVGFKNEEKNKIFYDFAYSFTFLKEGVIYKKKESKGEKIYFVDYNLKDKKEIIQGNCRIISLMSNYYYFKRLNFEKDYVLAWGEKIVIPKPFNEPSQNH